MGHQSFLWLVLLLWPEGGVAFVSGERGFPAGGAGSDAYVCGGI